MDGGICYILIWGMLGKNCSGGQKPSILFRVPRRLLSGVTLSIRYVGPGLKTRATKNTSGVLFDATGLNKIIE